jgi:hypothetical protein
MRERRIRAAAVRAMCGRVWEGFYHAEAVQAAQEGGCSVSLMTTQENMGFVTTDGQWLSRQEALEVATGNGQAREPEAMKKCEWTQKVGLLSEDTSMDFDLSLMPGMKWVLERG